MSAEYLQGVQGSIGSSSSGKLEIPAQVAKAILETIKKGDLDGVKMEIDKYCKEVGGNIEPQHILPYIHDDKYHHNAIFYAALIKEEQPCLRMVEYLVQHGVDAAI